MEMVWSEYGSRWSTALELSVVSLVGCRWLDWTIQQNKFSNNNKYSKYQILLRQQILQQHRLGNRIGCARSVGCSQFAGPGRTRPDRRPGPRSLQSELTACNGGRNGLTVQCADGDWIRRPCSFVDDSLVAQRQIVQFGYGGLRFARIG